VPRLGCPGTDQSQHVAVEDLWAPPLLRGSTIEDIGDRFDGDQLGSDPRASWRAAHDSAVRAVNELSSADRPVHLSFGDFPASFYLTQLIFDHVVHLLVRPETLIPGAATLLGAGQRLPLRPAPCGPAATVGADARDAAASRLGVRTVRQSDIEAARRRELARTPL
jgi:hypothetical protein